MLTNVFYYNLYKPYIVTNRTVDNYAPKRSRIADRRDNPETTGRMFVLNKSLKDEIVRYAQAVSHGVTTLRTSTKRIANDMEQFNRTVYEESLEEAINLMADNLSDFADNFNRSAGFMQQQVHSAGLRSFSHEVVDNVYYNRQRLEMLGLTLSDAGILAFSRDYVEGMSHEEVNIAIGENIKIFSDLQSFTQQLMTEPLVEHMRFKGLRYHYNYKLGMMETEGFSLIEAGMLVDRRV